jgi:gamma-glutamylcyclotransferase (GGCT)/AIG2-like uncharacterized protein YtfP
MGSMLFVYGTLMPGHARWPLIEGFVDGHGPATVRGRLFDTGHGYPAARFDAEGEIDGHLVRFRPDREREAWATVDAIEGEGELYHRVEVVTVGGEEVKSYAWAGDVSGLTVLGRRWNGS